MSRIRTFFLLSAALAIGACSDTQTPSAPSDPTSVDKPTLQLDESVGATGDVIGGDEAGAQLGVAGKGKSQAPHTEAVGCVHNRFHELCIDVRNGVLRAARADAIVNRNNRSTRAQLRLNGRLIAFSGRFGPNFVGDEIFGNYRNLNRRVFRGDLVCSQFPGATPQVCGRI